MTDDTARLVERDLAVTVVPERYLMAAPPFTPTPDPCAHLRVEVAAVRSQLTAARERSLTNAKLLREAAELHHWASVDLADWTMLIRLTPTATSPILASSTDGEMK